MEAPAKRPNNLVPEDRTAEAKLRHANGTNSRLPKALHGDLDPKEEILHERPWHRRAIEMAANGLNSREIGLAMDKTPTQVSKVLRQNWAREKLIDKLENEGRETLQEMLQKAVDGAFQRVVELSESAKSEQVRLAANNTILDRWLGKPNQPIDLTSNKENLDDLSDEELDRRIATLRSQAKAASDSRIDD